MSVPIEITGIMWRDAGDRLIIEVEYAGKWLEIGNEYIGDANIREHSFSEIIEPTGIISLYLSLISEG